MELSPEEVSPDDGRFRAIGREVWPDEGRTYGVDGQRQFARYPGTRDDTLPIIYTPAAGSSRTIAVSIGDRERSLNRPVSCDGHEISLLPGVEPASLLDPLVVITLWTSNLPGRCR